MFRKEIEQLQVAAYIYENSRSMFYSANSRQSHALALNLAILSSLNSTQLFTYHNQIMIVQRKLRMLTALKEDRDRS
jgi:hypothetical protein